MLYSHMTWMCVSYCRQWRTWLTSCWRSISYRLPWSKSIHKCAHSLLSHLWLIAHSLPLTFSCSDLGSAKALQSSRTFLGNQIVLWLTGQDCTQCFQHILRVRLSITHTSRVQPRKYCASWWPIHNSYWSTRRNTRPYTLYLLHDMALSCCGLNGFHL